MNSMRICTICRKVKTDDCELCKKKVEHFKVKESNYEFYNSYGWRKFSIRYRKQHPLCVRCLTIDRATPSQVVDHIRPINKGGDKWSDDNLQALCHRCHNSKSGREK